MKTSVIFIGFFLSLITNLSFAQTPGKIIKGSNFEGVILGKNVETNNSNTSSWKRWLPSEDEILQMEKLLPEFLAKKTAQKDIVQWTYKAVLAQLREYRRQYFGYIKPNGEKIILVSSFLYQKDSNFSFKDWDKEFIYFYDGGTDAWRITYHVKKRKFSGFNVNSLA